MVLRTFAPADAGPCAELIALTLRTSNARDYGADYIDALLPSMSAEALLARAESARYLVALEGDRIVGCGGLQPPEAGGCELVNVFVHPAFQGRGVGRRLVRALEERARALGVRRATLHASITALDFYRRLGYEPCGDGRLDAHGLYAMEKALDAPADPILDPRSQEQP